MVQGLKKLKRTYQTYIRKSERINPNMNMNFGKLKALWTVHPVAKHQNTPDAKIAQLRKLFARSRYVNKGQGFVYSIDEACVPVLDGKVIDNMPIDYGKIVDNSLDDLVGANRVSNGTIAQQNLKMLVAIEEYVQAFCRNEMPEESRQHLLGMLHRRAETLAEALQRILFWNQMLWQSKHTLVGLGRLDKVLDRFEVPENVEEMLCNFLVTLHAFYNFKSSMLMGDTGQIILLGGLEQDGSYFCNCYTYLFLRCLMKVRLPDPKILLRVAGNVPEDLLALAIESISTGIGSPLLSNDEVIVPLLRDFGYSEEDAFNYGVSACWEPLAIGKSLEQNNIATIGFGMAMNQAILDERFTACATFEDVFLLYSEYLLKNIDGVFAEMDVIDWECEPLETLLTDGCLENGKDLSQGGAVYNNYGILSVGMSSAVDSLLNLQSLCYERGEVNLEDLQKCIREDYQGCEELRECLGRRQEGFGTDSEAAIGMTNRILDVALRKVDGYRNRFGGKAKFGLSSPGYLNRGKRSGATADGRRARTPFATHISRDTGEALTEIVNFASKLHYEATDANANVIDILISPTLLTDTKEKFMRFVRAAIGVGFFQMQFNVVSYAQLVDAKAHPDRYTNLIVRVWGFSAYFNDLPEEYKDLLICRAKAMERIA